MTRWSEILKASKGLHARDSFSEMWGLKVKANKAEWPEITITGTLPLTYTPRAEQTLKNYALYGSASGAGVETENLFDYTTITRGRFMTTTGEDGYDSARAHSDYIPVTGGETYYLKNVVNRSVYYTAVAYTSNKTVLGYVNISSGTADTITLPQNAAYIIINLGYSQRLTASCTLGSTAPTAYIPFGYKIPLTNTGENSQSKIYPLYIGDSKLGEEEYADYQEQKVYKRTANLYNDADTEFGGLCIKDDDGNQVPSQESHYTLNYTSVEPSSTYYLAGTLSTNIATWRVYFYTQNKGWIMRSSQIQSAVHVFNTPSNCYYIQLQCNITSDTSDWVLVKGSTAPAQYIPYLQPTDPPAPFPAITAYAGENTLSSTETVGECSVTGRIKSV